MGDIPIISPGFRVLSKLSKLVYAVDKVDRARKKVGGLARRAAETVSYYGSQFGPGLQAFSSSPAVPYSSLNTTSYVPPPPAVAQAVVEALPSLAPAVLPRVPYFAPPKRRRQKRRQLNRLPRSRFGYRGIRRSRKPACLVSTNVRGMSCRYSSGAHSCPLGSALCQPRA